MKKFDSQKNRMDLISIPFILLNPFLWALKMLVGKENLADFDYFTLFTIKYQD